MGLIRHDIKLLGQKARMLFSCEKSYRRDILNEMIPDLDLQNITMCLSIINYQPSSCIINL